MLKIRDVHSYYGRAHVIQGLSLTVPEGSLVALLGRNGMGKTSLVRSIMNMTPPEVRQGSIRYQGEELVGKPSYHIAGLDIGLVPQGRRIFPSLSVMENLTIASRPPRNSGDGQAGWDVERVFDLFPRLGERLHHRGDQLSGGEQQMLTIARALMTNPRLLLMDEPSEGLAPLLVQQIKEQLLALKEIGLSIFLVEQNLGLALALADDVYVIERGQVVYHGRPDELDANREVKRQYLGV